MNVLAVDDSPTIREMVRVALVEGVESVVTATDAEDALGLIDRQRFDIVITDYNMPGMNGIELVEVLRSRAEYRHVPILMLTTESDEELKREGRRAGCTGWIVKPFDPVRLLSVVKKLGG